MKNSIHNSIRSITHLYIALFLMTLLLLSSGANGADAASVDAHVVRRQTNTQTMTAQAVTSTVFSNDHSTPLAREDVTHLKTAVVPGRVRLSPSHSSPTAPRPQYQNGNSGQSGNSVLPLTPPANPQVSPAPPEESSEEKIQREITSRFSDPKMLSFMSRTSMQELTSLYHEASRMIDARHVSPIGYEARVENAVRNIVAALDNATFLKATGAVSQSATIQQTQNELLQAVRYQPARSATDAVGMMQWTANLLNKRLGVRQEAVALEFFNGMVDSLDKYSAFMPVASGYSPGAGLKPVRTAGLEERIVGIGVEMESHAQGAIIVGIVDNSPASELKLQEGDLIVAVNRESVRGLDLNTLAGKLGGPSGRKITLDIDRNGQLFRGSLTRRSIYVSSVTGTKMIDVRNKVGYVRLKQFSASSRKDLEAAMWKLYRQGMKSLVLDLRGNPGGLLDQAIEVSNLYVPHGTIVSTKGRNLSDNTSETATYEKTWSTPLVVLVDDNSASASEILAAAIQENGRGVVVGRRSYGKGTVQTHFPLQTVSGQLKLTTAKFYSPQGREMAGSGVTPDIIVNQQTTGYRGTDSDSDIDAALATIAQGRPGLLAEQASQRRPGQNNANLSSLQNSPATWGNQIQSKLFSH